MAKISYDILKIRDFRFLLLTRIFSIFGLQAQAIIVGWQIYSITKDPLMLGLVGLAEALPAITGALFAGHLVDNNKPKIIYALSLMVLFSNCLFLLMTAGGVLDIDQNMIVTLIFAGVIMSGFARCFIMPCSFTLTALIIRKRDMPQAAAWQISGFKMALIIGPAFAGIIYGSFGEKIAWMIPVISLGLALISIYFLKSYENKKPEGKKIKTWKSIKEGWAFIFKNQTLLSIMTIDMFAVLFGGAVAMLPAFADQILNVGSEGLGILRAAPAVGAILTTIIMALYPMKIIKGSTLLWVVTGFGICMIGFGLSTYFWVSILFLMLSGAFDSISMIIRGTLMQFLTPDNMRGRVSSVNSMFIISSNEIGAFESGVAARFLGLAPSVVFGGFGTLIVVGMAAILAPKLRKLRYDTDDMQN